MNIDIVITGTGRCGTLYVARLLNSIGILCGHESIYTPKGLDHVNYLLSHREQIRISNISTTDGENWIPSDQIKNICADSSYLSAPFLSLPPIKKAKIVHLVRNPIYVISSYAKDFNYFGSHKPRDQYEKFVYKHLPILTDKMSRLKRAMTYYIKWNELIEKSRNDLIFHRIEDGGETLLEKLSLGKHNTIYSNKKANTRYRYERFTLNDFDKENIGKEIRNVMEKYGYDTKKYNLHKML